jgi:uncharacterized protein YfaP (DUF2135 family)
VTDASTGFVLAGALVSVQGTAISATSAANGTFTIPCAPTGAQILSTSRSGYGTRTDNVSVPINGTVDVAIALNPTGSCGAVGEVKVVLTWGASPSDLDSHLSGPDIEHAGQTRFHMAFYDRDPVSYVSLDVDDTTSFGPETVTVTRLAAGFVAGDYHYWIHNYSTSPEFNGSSGVITVSQCDANLTPVQVTQLSIANASGDPALDLWHVFDFSLTSGGTLSITPVQTFLTGTSTTIL